MKHLLAVLALTLVLAPALAQEQSRRTTFTKANPLLRLMERSDSVERGSFASWKGKLELTGKLILEFDRAPPDEPEHENSGMAFFAPDPNSRKKLPEAKGYYPLPVTQVELGKTALEILTPLIGREQALGLVLSKVPRYEVPVAISLTSFSTSVDCDHRIYAMEFSSIRLLRPDLMALAEGRGLGC